MKLRTEALKLQLEEVENNEKTKKVASDIASVRKAVSRSEFSSSVKSEILDNLDKMDSDTKRLANADDTTKSNLKLALQKRSKALHLQLEEAQNGIQENSVAEDEFDEGSDEDQAEDDDDSPTQVTKPTSDEDDDAELEESEADAEQDGKDEKDAKPIADDDDDENSEANEDVNDDDADLEEDKDVDAADDDDDM